MGNLSYEAILRSHIKDVNRRVGRLEKKIEKIFRKLEDLKGSLVKTFECAKCVDIEHVASDMTWEKAESQADSPDGTSEH